MADLGGSTYSLRIKAVLDTSDINQQLNRIGRSVQNGRARAGADVGAGGGAAGRGTNPGAALAAAQSFALVDNVNSLRGSIGGVSNRVNRYTSQRAQKIYERVVEKIAQKKIQEATAAANPLNVTPPARELASRLLANMKMHGPQQFSEVKDGRVVTPPIPPAVKRQFNETVRSLESAQKKATEATQKETEARKAHTQVFSKATIAMSAFFTVMQAADRAMAYWSKSREPVQQDLFRSGKFAQLHADVAVTDFVAALSKAAMKIVGLGGAGKILGSDEGSGETSDGAVSGKASGKASGANLGNAGKNAAARAGTWIGVIQGVGDVIDSYFTTKEKMNEYDQLLRESIRSTSSAYEFEKGVKELEASVRKSMGGDLGVGILSIRGKIADLERRVYEKQGEQYGYGKTIEPYGVYGKGEEWIIASQNYMATGNAIEEMREKIQQYNVVLGKLEKEEVKRKADLLNREERAVDKFTDVMAERSLDFKALTSLGERGLHATANLQTAQSIYSQCSKIYDVLTRIEQKEGGIVWR